MRRLHIATMQIAALVFMLLATTTLLLAREKTDVITMKNGDKITGEIKGLHGGVLAVDLDYVDGTISLDWAKVMRLESSQLFVVMAEDGSSYEGTLHTIESAPSQPMNVEIIEQIGKKIQVERSHVVKLTETSERVVERFNGAVNLGVIYSKGNSATQYNFGTEVEYLRERWAAQSFYSSTLSSSSGATTSTRNQLQLSGYHLLPWENYYYGGLGNFLQSSVQGIRLQTTVGGGLGHFFKNTNSTNIAVLAGFGLQSTNYKPPGTTPIGTNNLAAALVAAQIKLFKFKKTNLDVNALLVPALSDFGHVRFDTNITYYLKLFKNLNWNASFYGNWDNRPPPGLTGSDYGTSSGLSWTFGNR